VNGILKNVGGVFIDGNFFDVPEDLLSTSIVELLVEARKLPEFVVFFKIDQKTYLERNFDTKVIQKEYQTKMAELKARR
jgi:adenylate/nucleoside-diphosphate kinase